MMATAKGEQTRARILRVAGELFSRRSFDTVSMRAIGKAATVDPALISHYFGSKEGLFEAVLEDAIHPGLLADDVRTHARDHWGEQLVRYGDELWKTPAGHAMLALARRSIAGDTSMLRNAVSRMILARIADLLDGTDDERRLRASLVGSQMAGLLLARHIVKLEPLASLSTDEVVALVGPNVQHYLTGPLP